MFTFGGDGQPHESSVILQFRARAVPLLLLSADFVHSRFAPLTKPVANLSAQAPEIQRKRVTHGSS